MADEFEPSATLLATVADANCPIATAELAAAATVDSAPRAMEFFAPAWAPRVVLLPMAIAPSSDAVVELATVSAAVPAELAAEPPMATLLTPSALLPKPAAVLAIPDAMDSNPSAVPHFAALARKPNAAPPAPVTSERLP
ncbi:hypothetical protein BTN82_12560 [Pseudomonas chlororaphis]|uniref:DNA-directed RNA polymerase II n=1 Tax=Pseudomonas chlororaphis TaxID=587753 RepID=A0A1Q8ERA6_9PSED|nr:hypothetical protein BTN82_12560 [Pseudomonas chlororaphis]